MRNQLRQLTVIPRLASFRCFKTSFKMTLSTLSIWYICQGVTSISITLYMFVCSRLSVILIARRRWQEPNERNDWHNILLRLHFQRQNKLFDQTLPKMISNDIVNIFHLQRLTKTVVIKPLHKGLFTLVKDLHAAAYLNY